MGLSFVGFFRWFCFLLLFLLPLSNKVYFKLVTGDNCEVFPASVVNILVFNHGNVNFDFSYNGSYIYLAC